MVPMLDWMLCEYFSALQLKIRFFRNPIHFIWLKTALRGCMGLWPSLEISLAATPRGFESHPLRHKTLGNSAFPRVLSLMGMKFCMSEKPKWFPAGEKKYIDIKIWYAEIRVRRSNKGCFCSLYLAQDVLRQHNRELPCWDWLPMRQLFFSFTGACNPYGRR